MNSENVSRWVAAAANFAGLAGLILVAIQIRQNSELQRISLVNEGMLVSSQVYANLMGENPAQALARAAECPERMNYADYMAVDAFMWSNWNAVYRDYRLYKEGLFSDSDWKDTANVTADWLIGNKFSQLWWDRTTREQEFFDREFADYVNQRVQSIQGMDG